MVKLSLTIWALFCVLNLFYTPSISCPHYQLEALVEFQSLLYNHSETSQRNNYKDQFWNSSISCCKWEGVTCSARGAVTELILGSALIDGTSQAQIVINAEALNPLFRVTSLIVLDFSGCGIRGKISGPGFANLSRLTTLELGKNKFEGFIPGEIFSNLKNLQHLSMSENLLQGKIPEEIGNLTQLQSLSLSENSLAGEVPRSIFNLKRLEFLNLQKNSLHGEIPSEIGNLTNMIGIILNDNNLRGKLPSLWQKMESLTTLQLRNNDLYGDIPTGLFHLPEMRYLLLGGNKLSWNNSDEAFSPTSSLMVLSLASCNLSGPFPNWLSNQTGLTRLDLSDNHLEGVLPPWLAQLGVGNLILANNRLTGSLKDADLLFQEGLYLLDLSKNNFHGELPASIGEARNISILLLSGNKFSGSLPKSFSRLDQLQLLDLSDNNLAGGNDKFPVFCPSLQWIDISLNNFSGELPIFSFPPTTRVLSLGQNNFQGRLPINLATKLLQLQQLDLHDNNLTGEIPASISNLSLLQVLNLRNNKLEGSIPEQLSTIPNLRILDLSNNHLKGVVSSSLGSLSGMTSTVDNLQRQGSVIGLTIDFLDVNIDCECQDVLVNWKKSKQTLSNRQIDLYSILDLSNNQLSGQLPPSLGHLKGLKLLNLSFNSISGQIPSSLGDLKTLEILDFSHNRLSVLNWLDVSNNQLTGPIPESAQMDRINDPIFYANNSGLCGAQIQKPCNIRNEGAPPPLQFEEDDDQELVSSEIYDWILY
ncbi:hypothetical protein Leryth_026326 [Lithospermum erythrorhizon]|nr:hypothetical protein Leryth_026326 [Lithospermum erythrorhizon]